MTRAETELIKALIGNFRLNKLSLTNLAKHANEPTQTPGLSQRLAEVILVRAAEVEVAELRKLHRVH